MHTLGGDFPEDIPGWTASELRNDMISTINYVLKNYDAYRVHLTPFQEAQK